jgi:hypothetical protein
MSWKRAGLEDEIDGELPVVLIVGDERGEVALFVEWDNRQQGVARQREVLGDVDSPEPVAVFLPHAVVLLVVVAVLNAPVLADGRAEADEFFRRTAGDEVPEVEVLLVGMTALDPLPFHRDRAAGAEQLDIKRLEWLGRDPPDVDPTVVAVVTQVKKGAS